MDFSRSRKKKQLESMQLINGHKDIQVETTQDYYNQLIINLYSTL